jgi:mercuric ion transport protein
LIYCSITFALKPVWFTLSTISFSLTLPESKKTFYAAVTGTVVVALCCFTPILVITLSAIGLSVFTPYLDYVLLPTLVLLIILTVMSYLRWKKYSRSGNQSSQV